VNQRTVNKKSMESLVLAGALDCFPQMHRAQYFYVPPTDPVTGLERLVRFGNQFQASSAMATNSLFGAAVMPEVKPPMMPECDKWGLPELLDREKEVVGIYLSSHPLDGFKFEMDNYGFTPLSELEANKGRNIRIAGFVTDAVHATTKKGSKFGKMVINDYSGNHEIVLWEKNYVAFGNYLVNGQKLMLQGVYAENRFRPGVMEFQIQSMMLLDEVRKAYTKKLLLALNLRSVTNEFFAFIEDNVKKYPGNTDLIINVNDDEMDMTVRLKSQSKRIVLNDDMIRYLQDHEEIRYSIDKV
jgi:DNA polymerase-3 subunit alpha